MNKILLSNAFVIILLLGAVINGQTASQNDRFPHKDVMQYYPAHAVTLRDYYLNLKEYLAKDEFETDAEFKRRIEFFLSKAKIGVYPSSDFYPSYSLNSLWIPVKLTLKYDPEDKIFSVEEANHFAIDEMIYPPYKYNEYLNLIAEIPVSSIDKTSKTLSVRISIPMEPVKARKSKDPIRVSFQGAVVSYDGRYEGFSIIPSKYAVFNRKTGEIIKEGLITEIQLTPLVKRESKIL